MTNRLFQLVTIIQPRYYICHENTTRLANNRVVGGGWLVVEVGGGGGGNGAGVVVVQSGLKFQVIGHNCFWNDWLLLLYDFPDCLPYIACSMNSDCNDPAGNAGKPVLRMVTQMSVWGQCVPRSWHAIQCVWNIVGVSLICGSPNKWPWGQVWNQMINRSYMCETSDPEGHV